MKSIYHFITTSCIIALVCTESIVHAQSNLSIAKGYLQSNLKTYNLSENDIANWIVTDNYVSKHNGLNHIYLQQTYNGIPVENAIININVSNNRKVVSSNSRFITNINDKARGTQRISSLMAVNNALSELQIEKPAGIQMLENRNDARKYSKFQKFDDIDSDITSQLTYIQETTGVVSLVWETEVHTIEPKFNAWKVYVDASSGEILKKINMVLECRFETPDDDCHYDTKTGEHAHHSAPITSDHSFAGDTYLVFDSPVESPNHGGRTIVMDPADPIASPYGWHDTDGIAGAEYTITRGNNVWA
ncbi:MAG: hypothetical protein HKN68_02650, partial [Saprospiraceae bacterium]|nr:hypothetical protein [Saprospiraceae bacterium]